MTHKQHTRFPQLRSRTLLVVLLAAVLVLTGCSEIYNMEEQPRIADPYADSPEFGVAARDLDPNAVPVGFLREDTHFYQGRVDGSLATEFPIEITQEVLTEGQRQYNAFCAICHGYAGYGDGVLADEGLVGIQSFHTDELRARQVGYHYDVITNGVGQMFSYGSRIEPANRWAIVAYVRALQLSQYADTSELPEDILSDLEANVSGPVDPTSAEAMTMDDDMPMQAEAEADATEQPEPAATEAMEDQ